MSNKIGLSNSSDLGTTRLGSNPATDKMLRRWEQNILCKKFDCEDGVLCRQLLKLVFWRKKDAAHSFVKDLEGVKVIVAANQSGESLKDREEIWSTVFQRISNEERAARLLGLRAVSNRTGYFDRIKNIAFVSNNGSRSTWYGAGAMVTASIVGLTFYIQQPQKISNSPYLNNSLARSGTYVAPQMLPDVNAVSAVTTDSVSDTTSYGGGAPIVSSVSTNKPVYFDWLKSKGSVRFIEDGQQQLPIFWVSPKSKGVKNGSGIGQEASLVASQSNKRTNSFTRRHH